MSVNSVNSVCNERKHGFWVGLEYDGYADGNPVYDLWECSVCGEEVSGEDVPDTHPYCHACGSKMDLEPIAYWVQKKEMIRSPFANNYLCSNCKTENHRTTPFCPQCGHKMLKTITIDEYYSGEYNY